MLGTESLHWELGFGPRRKLQISGYTALALDLKFKHGWDKKYLWLFLLGDDYVVLDLHLTKTIKNVFWLFDLDQKHKNVWCVHLECCFHYFDSRRGFF